jgi:hypothetical protein
MRFIRNLFRNKQRDSELPQLLNGNDYPDFWEQIEGFKKFAESVNQGAKEGKGILVPEEVSKLRLEECGRCDYYDKQQNRCKKCGCYMKVKVKFVNTSCPVGKW